MLTGDVALSNVMGPVGMAHHGAQVASRGTPWLLWFLCNISANLAVVNFLPIPIVDGGLFTLLILEKIQGKPLSADAQRIVQMVGLVLILGRLPAGHISGHRADGGILNPQRNDEWPHTARTRGRRISRKPTPPATKAKHVGSGTANV